MNVYLYTAHITSSHDSLQLFSLLSEIDCQLVKFTSFWSLILQQCHQYHLVLVSTDNFTGVCLVAWSLNESEVEVDLTLINLTA